MAKVSWTKKRLKKSLTKLEGENDTLEAHGAADEAWHWPKPSAALGTAHQAGLVIR